MSEIVLVKTKEFLRRYDFSLKMSTTLFSGKEKIQTCRAFKVEQLLFQVYFTVKSLTLPSLKKRLGGSIPNCSADQTWQATQNQTRPYRAGPDYMNETANNQNYTGVGETTPRKKLRWDELSDQERLVLSRLVLNRLYQFRSKHWWNLTDGARLWFPSIATS